MVSAVVTTIIPCVNWQDCGVDGGGGCAINAYGENKTVAFSVCLRACQQYDGPARGRGDVIHKVAKVVTLGLAEPCNGCQDRRVTQNAKHPSKLLAGVAS